MAALAEAERAQAELPTDADPLDRAWALAIHARVVLNSDLGDRDAEAEANARRAIEIAREADLPAVEADASATLAVLAVDDPEGAAGC